MNKQPKVSVVIPTYNRWPVVCEAIDSVLNQTYPNTECIVVDDCSNDGSFEKVREKYGDRVKLLRNDVNREKSYSRNHGTRASDADYVCYLDSDDVLLDTAVESRVRVFAERGLSSGAVYGITLSADDNDTQLSARVYRKRAQAYRRLETLDDYLADKQGLRTNSLMISRAEMLTFGLFDENLTNREDIELLIRLFCHVTFYFCGEAVSLLRSGGVDRARDNWRKIIAQGYRFSDALRGNPHVSRTLGKRLPLIALEEHRELLRALYRGGYYREYREKFMAAFRQDLPFVGFKYCRRYLASFFAGKQRAPGV